MHAPCQQHLDVAYRELHYLKGTPSQGILLPSSSSLSLQAYCDFDMWGCSMTRKSTMEYIVFLGPSPISWRSKKQIVVACFSVEVVLMGPTSS